MNDATAATPLIRVPLALRWRDLDAFDHVNNANFLTFLEEARVQWFRSLPDAWLDATRMPLLAAVQINYRRPIPYPAAVAVELFAERVGNTSLTIGHRIVGDDAANDGVLYADGHTVMVWIERESGRPVALPEGIRAAVAQGH
jgi:acyl-CoA thioester hydrolase